MLHQYKLELEEANVQHEVMHWVASVSEEVLRAIRVDTRSSPAQGSTLPLRIVPSLVRRTLLCALCKCVQNWEVAEEIVLKLQISEVVVVGGGHNIQMQNSQAVS